MQMSWYYVITSSYCNELECNASCGFVKVVSYGHGFALVVPEIESCPCEQHVDNFSW